MKDSGVLQARTFEGAQWYYYQDGEWWASYYDSFGYYTFPKADVLRKGTRLHVRLAKPQRPNALVTSHSRKTKHGSPSGQGSRWDLPHSAGPEGLGVDHDLRRQTNVRSDYV